MGCWPVAVLFVLITFCYRILDLSSPAWDGKQWSSRARLYRIDIYHYFTPRSAFRARLLTLTSEWHSAYKTDLVLNELSCLKCSWSTSNNNKAWWSKHDDGAVKKPAPEKTAPSRLSINHSAKQHSRFDSACCGGKTRFWILQVQRLDAPLLSKSRTHHCCSSLSVVSSTVQSNPSKSFAYTQPHSLTPPCCVGCSLIHHNTKSMNRV